MKNTLLSILLAIIACSCDSTIHFYPEPQSSLVILQLSVDRTPPHLYKEIKYDSDWQCTTISSHGYDAEYDYPADYLMRITIEIYRYYGEVGRIEMPEIDDVPIERRVLLVSNDCLTPQDTIQVHLPDGQYKALAFADYVPTDKAFDWHYKTENLTDITTDLSTYPRNPHLRSSAAGSVYFNMTHQLNEEGYPVILNAPTRSITSRVIPINLQRASGCFKIMATDWKLCPIPEQFVSLELLFTDFVTTGYNVWTEEPSDYTTSYGYITKPPLGNYEESTDSRLMVMDYLFAPSDREMEVHAILIATDPVGNILNTTPTINIPLVRDATTIIYMPTYSVNYADIHGESGFGVCEGFEGEITIIL
ncbi:MAG: DUF6562 domain-containing protein [Muribaculaceae bacterium]